MDKDQMLTVRGTKIIRNTLKRRLGFGRCFQCKSSKKSSKRVTEQIGVSNQEYRIYALCDTL